MLYPKNQDFQTDVTTLKDKYNKRNKKKEYMNPDIQEIMKIYTRSWCYGNHPQKDCKLGPQSLLPRLCSHFIKSNLKIPKSCIHSFCIFAKAHNCCQQFRWIYKLNKRMPYLQFNLYQTITNTFPAESSYKNDQFYQFTMKAIFDRIINEMTSNNQLVIRVDEKVTCSLILKRIGRDALAKAFDAKTDGFRVSYVPSDQKIAISVTQNIVMILSGGIVGTGYCNLVKNKSKKTKDWNDQHAIIHILDEHLKDINIRFFVKNGFDGTIDVEIKSGEHLIKLITPHLSYQPMHENDDKDDKDDEDDDMKYDTTLSPQLSLPQTSPMPQIQASITNPFIPFPPPLLTAPTSYNNTPNFQCTNNNQLFMFNDHASPQLPLPQAISNNFVPMPQIQEPSTNSFIPIPPPLLCDDDNFAMDQSFIFNDCESVYNVNNRFLPLLSPDTMFHDIFDDMNVNSNPRKRRCMNVLDEDNNDNNPERKRQRVNSNFYCNQSVENCRNS